MVNHNPPSIKARYREAKMKNTKRIKKIPRNREVFNLLMGNPYITKKERDQQIRQYCGFLMPRILKF